MNARCDMLNRDPKNDSSAWDLWTLHYVQDQILQM